jgi:2-succinyl-5-enolpyruvyl-6-hydroxy-3-cyclohexene-1-carboxylate synthase
MRPEPDPEPSTAEPSQATEGDVAATYCATLVDEWVRNGLTDAVVSPGSRSTPMALALAARDDVRVQLHHDERSASFMALGIGAATGRPAALLCTSGTAAAQFHAAVVEAHQAFVPMLVLTADRPAELQGVGAPQTIDQRDLYGTSVRWYCEPGAPAAGGAPWWRDLARDAWSRSQGERPGPVHLNLAFREPLVGVAGELPPTRAPMEPLVSGARWGLTDERLAALVATVAGRRGVLVAGARAARTADDAAAVHRLAAHLGWPVLADPLSGCRLELDSTITTADGLLRHDAFAESHRPEVAIRLGGLSTSKALLGWLARSGAFQLGVDRFGASPDPDRVLADHAPVDIATFCRQLVAACPAAEPRMPEGHEGSSDRWAGSWTAAERAARRAIERRLGSHAEATEPAVAVDVMTLLSDDGILVASSSMPIRDLEWYAPARDHVTVLANRGANGIDGVVSTAVGAASGGAPTALLIGDVAFLHDANGLLGVMQRGVNLTVVVLDNDGGGIFSFLPQRDQLEADRFEQLFGTPHGVDLTAIAAAHGVPCERVATRTGVQAALAGALTRGGPRVVVVDTDRDANVAVHAELHAAIAAACDDLVMRR